MKNAGYLPLLLLFPVCAGASDFERALAPEKIIEQRVIPAPEASAVRQAPPGYCDYYETLAYYSDEAYKAVPGTDAYFEASMSGSYLRNKVDEIEAAAGLSRSSSLPPQCSLRPLQGPVESVSAELRETFGSGTGQAKAGPVVIKAGFAKVVFIKGVTPYLAQDDSFLKQGEVILTFDDGPAPGAYSRDVADDLRAHSASAAFFVLGQKLGPDGRAILKYESGKGHNVAVHGYYHATESGKPFTAYGTAKILEQLGGVADTITSATGVKPDLFRPPYGVISPDALKALISDLDLTPLGWTIDTLDWSTKSPDTLYANTIAMIQRRGKGIVLMHDIHPQSRAAAKRLLVWLKDNNYTVVSPDRITQAFKAR